MSTIATPAETAARPGPASPRPTLVRRRLALDVSAAPDVLVRVLVLLRRRQCRIVGVAYQEADLHGPGRFEVTLLAPPSLAELIEPWLGSLVDVYAVQVRS
jgi:acetolactate synthase regulatory subunit